VKRDLAALATREHDLVVIGGGIAGACVAWDAALRGLSVALLERGDFCQATSAVSLKVVHGGIRYLQHADIARVRESCRERSAFLRIAPHLVRPLPFVIPTYGHGMQGKEILWAAFRVLSAATFDRNAGIGDPEQRIPGGTLVSREEMLRRFGDLVEGRGLTGAGMFYDGQLRNPPRLVLAIVESAVRAGALAANYCEVRGLLRDGARVRGVLARDTVTGDPLEVRARVVVNAAGPYAEEVLTAAGAQDRPRIPLSRDMAVVIGRRLVDRAALGVQTKYRDPDALLSRGNRHLFVVPWRSSTLIGVNSKVYEGDPSALRVSVPEVQGFLEEIREASPHLSLGLDDVTQVYAGLLPFGENTPGAKDLSFGKRSILVDHEARGAPGLISAVSVRFTTGRSVAERAIDLALVKLGKTSRACATTRTRVHGGAVESLAALEREAGARCEGRLAAEAVREVVDAHGSEYAAVATLVEARPHLAEPLGASSIPRAEVVHAVREEMALKLTDVVLRRTQLGTERHPGAEALRQCAELMGAELGWDARRIEREIDEANGAYPPWASHVATAK
jgi:glycerol-3-phosphate dehydrogenase